MRINLPITAQEYPFPKGQTLVSTTDLKGRILYCNPAFITVSGYSREELLGQPHNVIRHPDMPEEAFRDMWDTISNGQPWSAPVKNRRKDGSCYWVMANVTPLMQDGHAIGYMSVRTEPTREQVQASEKLYALMRQEKESGRAVHALRQGRLIRTTPWGRLVEALQPREQAKLTALFTLMAATAMGLGRWSVAGTSATAMAVIGALSLAGLASWYAGSLLLSPLKRLLGLANTMAAGDLTQRVGSDGRGVVAELEGALGQLNVNLQSIVRDARDEALSMSRATTEIADGNQNLSSRTEAQASNLQETAASMEEITGTVRHTADAAQQADDLSREATVIAQRSGQAVQDVTQMMQEIRESSARIGEIISVIDSIAFQTNILALNAAVEAARAGEQGKGFAVVAAEVRALAQRTSTAAREVKALIEDAGSRVEAGTRLTDAAQSTMSESVAAVQRVGQLIAEISHAAREQLSGISQVNQAVAQLEGITQQNAALVEQVAASAVSLQAQSQTVTETVRVFRIGDEAPAPDAVALRRAQRKTSGG